MNQPQIIELYNQRLLTTEQLAEFYEASETQIKTNFNRNKEKFIEEKHFITLKGDDLKGFKDSVTNCNLVGKNANQLILWTKQGASRHSKMLGTDRAWDMYDELEENYFNPKQQVEIPTTPRGLALLALSANEETNERLDDIDDRLVDIEENKLITTEDKGTVDRHVRKKIYQICKEQHFGQDAKSMLFQDLGSSIKRLFQVPNRGRIKDKDFTRVLEFIDNWQPSSVTKEQIKQLEFDFDDVL